MNYNVLFCDSALEDLANLAIYELQFARSVDAVEERMDNLVDSIVEGLEFSRRETLSGNMALRTLYADRIKLESIRLSIV